MPIDKLPPRYQPAAYKVRAFLMTDATALIILGACFLARGVGWLIRRGPAGPHPMTMIGFPVTAWIAVAVTLGVACLVVAVWHQTTAGAIVLAIAVALVTLWGMAFLPASVATFLERGSVYLALSVMTMWAIWRGRRGEITLDIRADPKGALWSNSGKA
ncbi:hypothetical protein [Corynebacterium renale]|uniref:hypothetical protein n=1 Tax=Corynebacterium renale TaxID=1724 RepID=UPI000DFEFB9D|nr:hypothetical protein [Corynebacterium renale]STC97454.1 Uncharacterised protein [Corynebacterium renale]STD70252.1 Uncharacterised protein [Corynebacterium renale]